MDDTPPPFSSQSPQFTPQQLEEAKSKKVVAGVLGILLGCLGIHKFVLGYTQAGLIMLGVTLVGWTLGACLTAFCIGLPFFGAAFAMFVIGLVEGITYLTKSDEEFCRTYIAAQRQWF